MIEEKKKHKTFFMCASVKVSLWKIVHLAQSQSLFVSSLYWVHNSSSHILKPIMFMVQCMMMVFCSSWN